MKNQVVKSVVKRAAAISLAAVVAVTTIKTGYLTAIASENVEAAEDAGTVNSDTGAEAAVPVPADAGAVVSESAGDVTAVSVPADTGAVVPESAGIVAIASAPAGTTAADSGSADAEMDAAVLSDGTDGNRAETNSNPAVADGTATDNGFGGEPGEDQNGADRQETDEVDPGFNGSIDPDGTDTQDTATAEEVKNQLQAAVDAAEDVTASVPFGDVNHEEQKAIEAENKTNEIVDEVNGIIKDAEDHIDEGTNPDGSHAGAAGETGGLLNQTTEDGKTEPGRTEQNTAGANDNMDAAEETMDAAQIEFNAALDEAESRIESGFTTSEEAQEVMDNLTQAQDEAQFRFDEAQARLDNAAINLEKAREDYEAARDISEEAADAAKKKLDVAEEELQKAVDATEEANRRVKKVQELLAGASGYLESWKEDVNGALEDVENKLNESRDELNAAIENLETGDEEVKQAAENFKEKFDTFTETAKDFNSTVKDAVDAQKKLEDLYDQYEELKEAQEAAQKAYDEAGGEIARQDAKEALSLAKEALEQAEEALLEAEKAKNDFQIINEKEYVKELQAQKDILSGETTDDEKAAAAKRLAELVIKNELAGKADGVEVIWVNPDGTSDGRKGAFGQSETGFYAVLDQDGNVCKRYGYKVNTNGDGTGSVNISEMAGKDTVNFIEIDGKPYQITVADGKEMIKMGGVDVPVWQDDAGEYYIKKDVVCDQVDDKSDLESLQIGPVKYDIKVDSSDSTKAKIYLHGVQVGTMYCDENGWNYKLEKFGIIISQGSADEYITYAKKEVINFEDGSTYDLQTSENGDYYIVDEDGNKIDLSKDDNGNYTYNNFVTFKAGGDENTVYDLPEGGRSSDRYLNAYNDFVAKENERDTKIAAYDSANTEFDEIEKVYQELTKAEDDFNEGNLNTLAYLPRSVSDMVANVDPDGLKNIEEVLKEINQMKNGSIDWTDSQAIIKLLKSVESLKGFIPDGVDVDEFIGELTVNLMFDKQPHLVPNSGKWSAAKHEYAQAWMNALLAKINVVNAGRDLVNATNDTLVSGMELIKAGADVNDAMLDVMFEGVKTGILAGAAGTLVFADDVLDVANQLVATLKDKVDALQAETQAAYDEARKAQLALENLKLKNPKEEELEAARLALLAAWERYEALNGELGDAKASLADAERYKQAAEDERDRLKEIENRPTGGNENEGGNQNPGGNENEGGNQNPGGNENQGGNQNPGGNQTAGGNGNQGGNQNSGGNENQGGNQNPGGNENRGGNQNPGGNRNQNAGGDRTTGGTVVTNAPVAEALLDAGTFAENAAPLFTAPAAVPAVSAAPTPVLAPARAAVVAARTAVLPVREAAEEGIEPVNLEDEEVPLASGIDAGEKEREPETIQAIPDEEVPLADMPAVCHLQWFILIMTIIFGAYNSVRIYGRHKEAEN